MGSERIFGVPFSNLLHDIFTGDHSIFPDEETMNQAEGIIFRAYQNRTIILTQSGGKNTPYIPLYELETTEGLYIRSEQTPVLGIEAYTQTPEDIFLEVPAQFVHAGYQSFISATHFIPATSALYGGHVRLRHGGDKLFSAGNGLISGEGRFNDVLAYEGGQMSLRGKVNMITTKNDPEYDMSSYAPPQVSVRGNAYHANIQTGLLRVWGDVEELILGPKAKAVVYGKVGRVPYTCLKNLSAKHIRHVVPSNERSYTYATA